MLRMRIEARPGLRWGMLGLATTIAWTAIAIDPADARSRRNKRTAPVSSAQSQHGPGYAAIVVDANSGATLHAANPDAIRHPASLTKIMTLYLLFERLESGKLSLDSQFRVSERAADQSPTKLGLREGSTIRVEDAIKGMVTRSANDAAVVVAENLAGSEEEFARQMTRKARALGMSSTVYRNASGLPDSAQVTTARDQAILGRAIQERFPRYYSYFATRSFTFRGQRIGNHNRLLGKVEGVDGIKTGYIRASGFNLVTSVRRNGRRVVAVVLGGTTAAARDARMRQLLAQHVDSASTRRTAPLIAEAPAREPPAARVAAPRGEPAVFDRFEMASARSAPTGSPPAAGSSDPIRPVAVRTVSVRPAPTAGKPAPAVAPPEPPPAPTARVESAPAAPVARAGMLGTLPVRTAPIAGPPQSAPPALPAAAAEIAAVPATVPSKPAARSGWVIQVGAYPAESEAQQRLTAVKAKAARLLASASPFTEPVQRGDTTLYRARFAGLDRDQAEAACRFLKRNEVECLAMRN
ncbi:MAG: D-alanyl-D-alanine carboxypeptidase [Hyphomicrobiales bacterium]|nr:D-alanyl-D-alanine carboxypeptidase [Hyphomicrobiales bacterium]